MRPRRNLSPGRQQFCRNNNLCSYLVREADLFGSVWLGLGKVGGGEIQTIRMVIEAEIQMSRSWANEPATATLPLNPQLPTPPWRMAGWQQKSSRLGPFSAQKRKIYNILFMKTLPSLSIGEYRLCCWSTASMLLKVLLAAAAASDHRNLFEAKVYNRRGGRERSRFSIFRNGPWLTYGHYWSGCSLTCIVYWL